MAVAEAIKATEAHAIQMFPHLRESDRNEIAASSNLRPRSALVCSVRNSTKAWTAMLDDEPVVMFGVGCVSMMSGVGSPWLLGTDRIRDIRTQFLRDSDWYISEMLEEFPKLTNHVDARNKLTLRWLKWCGFQIFDAEAYGCKGLPFHRILLKKQEWEKKHV